MNTIAQQRQPVRSGLAVQSPTASFGRVARSAPMARSANDPDAFAPVTAAALPTQADAHAVHLHARVARDRAVAQLLIAGWRRAKEVAHRLIDTWCRQRAMEETFRTLRALDARTLRDIGIEPGEIRSFAAELHGLTEVTRRRLVPAVSK